MKKLISDLKDNLRYEGRILFEDDCPVLGWSGSSVEFQGEFEGEISMDVEVKNPYYYDNYYYLNLYLVVDGKPVKTGLIKDEVKNIVIAKVEKGFHTIKVIKCSQGIFNSIKILALNFKGEIAKAPEKKKLSIEFIGDSITAGSVVMSYETKPEDLAIDSSSDAFYYYPAVTCRKLDAALYDVSTGGVGIVNYEGGFVTRSDVFYDYVDYYRDRELKWDFENNKMDVVVIALGTNDGAYHEKKAEYKELCRTFLKHVREKNPDAFIYWVYGMMFHNFDDVFEELINEENDGKMRYISMPSDGRGGYDHPGKRAHLDYGIILSQAIKRDLKM